MRASLLLPLLAVLASLGLAACGGNSDPRSLYAEGQTALTSGDYEGALADFEAALAAMQGATDHELFVEANLGAVEARIRIAPEQAKQDFLALAAARTADVTPKDFSYIGGKFASAGRFSEAIDVLDAGMQAHAESPQLKELQESIKVAAEKAGDSEALKKMAGLGYI